MASTLLVKFLIFNMRAALVFAVIALGCIIAATATLDDATTPKPTPSDWFECPGEGPYPNPYDCSKYFICISDNAWGMQCPAKLWFNPKKGYCDFKGNVDCDAKPTSGPKPPSKKPHA